MRNIVVPLLFTLSIAILSTINILTAPLINFEVSTVQSYGFDTSPYIDEKDNDTTWLKGILPPNLLGKDLIFQIKSPQISAYELYIFEQKQLSKQTPKASSNIKSRYPLYSFNTSQSTYYLKLPKKQSSSIPLSIQEQGQYFSQESQVLFKKGFYYGMVILTIILGLLSGIAFKTRRLIPYCILQISLLIALCYEEGFFYFVSQGAFEIGNLFIWIMPCISLTFCILISKFLKLTNSVVTPRALLTLLSLSLITLCICYSFYPLSVIKTTIHLLALSSPLVLLCLGVHSSMNLAEIPDFVVASLFVISVKLSYSVYLFIITSSFKWSYQDTYLCISYIAMIHFSLYGFRKYKQLRTQYVPIHNIELYTQQIQKSTNETLVHSLWLQTTYKLTLRETEVLHFIWEGLSNQQIAQQLKITINTTKYHVSNLYQKLQISNRHQALRFKQ